MVVLVTCKNEENPIQIEGARVFTTFYINFSDTQEQINPQSVVVSGRISHSFKLLCIFSSPARMKMIQSKMKELECSQHLSHYKSMGYSCLNMWTPDHRYTISSPMRLR